MQQSDGRQGIKTKMEEMNVINGNTTVVHRMKNFNKPKPSTTLTIKFMIRFEINFTSQLLAFAHS